MNFVTTRKNLTLAFENLTGETFEDSRVIKLNKEATVDVIDYLDGEDNLDDMQKALLLQNKASSEITILVENTAELEDIVKANEEKIIDKTATPQDVIAANESLAACCALFGFDKPVTVGFESLVNDPIEGLRVANEGLGDTITKGLKAVIEWFKKLFQGIWKFIKGLFSKEEQIDKNVKENIATIKVNETKIDRVKLKVVSDKFKTSPLAGKINNKTNTEVEEIIKNEPESDEVTAKVKALIEYSNRLLQSLKILGDPKDKSMRFDDLFKSFTKYVSGVTMFAESEHFWLTDNNYNNSKLLPELLNKAIGQNHTAVEVLKNIASESRYKEPVYDLLKKEPLVTAMSNFVGIDDLAKKAIMEVNKKLNNIDPNMIVSNVIECGAHSQFEPERNIRKDKFEIFYSWYELKNDKIHLRNDSLQYSELLDFTTGIIVTDDVSNLISNSDGIKKVLNYIETAWVKIRKQSELNTKVREETFKGMEKLISELESFIEKDDHNKILDAHSILLTIRTATGFNLRNSNNSIQVMANIQKLTTVMEKFVKAKLNTVEVDNDIKNISIDLVYKNDNIQVFNSTEDVIMTDYIGKLNEENTFQQWEEWDSNGKKFTIFINMSKGNKENIDAIAKYKAQYESK